MESSDACSCSGNIYLWTPSHSPEAIVPDQPTLKELKLECPTAGNIQEIMNKFQQLSRVKLFATAAFQSSTTAHCRWIIYCQFLHYMENDEASSCIVELQLFEDYIGKKIRGATVKVSTGMYYGSQCAVVNLELSTICKGVHIDSKNTKLTTSYPFWRCYYGNNTAQLLGLPKNRGDLEGIVKLLMVAGIQPIFDKAKEFNGIPVINFPDDYASLFQYRDRRK